MIKNIFPLALLILSLFSCVDNDKIVMVTSTGRINHVLVVMKNSDWTGEVGTAIKNIVTTPVEGLPQEEYQFSINQVSPREFNNLFKRTRNILFVGYDSINNFYTNTNVYANPQITLSILGKNKEELLNNINSHKNELISTFKNNDLKVYQKKITKEHHNIKDIETFNKHGFNLKIPKNYKMVEDNGDFIWYRYEFTKGMLNIIAYEIPFNFENNIEMGDVLWIRDSIGKKYIPGQFENTYMMTEIQYETVVKEVAISGKNALETRGLWFVKDDFMGGPFLSYTFPDKKNNQLVIIEGFSYSPSTKKRDFIFELEAILKTVVLE